MRSVNIGNIFVDRDGNRIAISDGKAEIYLSVEQAQILGPVITRLSQGMFPEMEVKSAERTETD